MEEIAKDIFKTKIAGLYLIKQTRHQDNRGFYAELSIIPQIEKATGQKFAVQQVNLSHSKSKVIRGFHAEGWNKLATVVSGTAFCALADIRPDSPTFAEVETFLLGDSPEATQGSLYISEGIANSFCVTNGEANYLYVVDKLYQDRDPAGDQAISLFDPDLKVNWPIPKSEMVYSDRDRQAKTLRELFPEKFS